MVRIKKTGAIERAIRRRSAQGKSATIEVIYPIEYAKYVHEDLDAHHDTGNAKFLERPARRLRPELMKDIESDLRQGYTLKEALLRAGLKLQTASQEECPVDTGLLRSSAYTRVK